MKTENEEEEYENIEKIGNDNENEIQETNNLKLIIEKENEYKAQIEQLSSELEIEKKVNQSIKRKPEEEELITRLKNKLTQKRIRYNTLKITNEKQNQAINELSQRLSNTYKKSTHRKNISDFSKNKEEPVNIILKIKEKDINQALLELNNLKKENYIMIDDLERAKSEEKRTENIKTVNLGEIKDENSGKSNYIDPLDFFKIEHPLEIDKNLEQFGLNDLESEEKKEEKKENEPNKKPKMKALIGAIGYKIKFDEMIKARNKIKKDDKNQQKKSLSVGSRTVKNNEKNKFEIINRTKEDRDQRLYIKLILAKNRFNKFNINQHDIYLDILNKISQLKEYPDKTGLLKKEINDIENNLKIKNIVLCPDVQIVDDEDETDSIGKQMSLEFIINKMKIKSDY